MAEHEPSQKTLQKAIDNHMLTISLLSTTGMTWWVSSVVFCGSILGGTWLKHDELAKLHYQTWFFLIVLVFFCSIATYGIWLALTFRILNRELVQLRLQLSAPHLSNRELSLFEGATWIGTSSFLLIALTWLAIWANIHSVRQDDPVSKPAVTAPNKK
jgi:ATP/ADP translocase